MISLCVPTRGRPDRFAQMLGSARRMARRRPFEVCAWLDTDDETAPRYPFGDEVIYGKGERPYVDGILCTSELWNRAWSLASGDIAMLAADDIIFRTEDWVRKVEQAFNVFDDKIVMVYGDDGTKRKAPVNPFVHRRWINTAGFTPEGFQGWYSDEWIWAIAAELGRVVFLRHVQIRHAHRPHSDATYRDGEMARAAVGDWPKMRDRFYSPAMTARRDDLVAKLRLQMDEERTVLPFPRPAWLEESLQLAEAAR